MVEIPMESGILPIGVVSGGTLRRSYTLRPMRVKDSLFARRSPDMPRAEGDDNLLGLISFAARLDIDGVPREEMTLDFMLELLDDDLTEILEADLRLKEEIARFRGAPSAKADPGAPEAAHPLGGSPGDGPAGSDAVA
jgi:hypothetical protein